MKRVRFFSDLVSTRVEQGTGAYKARATGLHGVTVRDRPTCSGQAKNCI